MKMIDEGQVVSSGASPKPAAGSDLTTRAYGTPQAPRQVSEAERVLDARIREQIAPVEKKTSGDGFSIGGFKVPGTGSLDKLRAIGGKVTKGKGEYNINKEEYVSLYNEMIDLLNALPKQEQQDFNARWNKTPVAWPKITEMVSELRANPATKEVEKRVVFDTTQKSKSKRSGDGSVELNQAIDDKNTEYEVLQKLALKHAGLSSGNPNKK